MSELHSIYHLQIFEKERDYEYFGTEFKNNKYYYTIDDLLSEQFVTNTDKDELLTKIINTNKDANLTLKDNTNEEDKLDFEQKPYEHMSRYMFYYHYLLPFEFVNPDQLQCNKHEIELSYPTIYDTYYKYTKYNEPVLMLDPDIYMSGVDNTDNEQLVYMVGHLNDVDDSIFNKHDTE